MPDLVSTLERRRKAAGAARFSVSLAATLTFFRSGQVIRVEVRNVSSSGLGLHAQVELDVSPGDRVGISFDAGRELHAIAAVRWKNERALGVELIALLPEDRTAYESLLREVALRALIE